MSQKDTKPQAQVPSSSELALDAQQKIQQTLDAKRKKAVAKRHDQGSRSARENLDHLLDDASFVEYGQLAVAAQRTRLDAQSLSSRTAADGIITGTGCVNSNLFGAENTRVAVAINDYSVLAGTQGYFHHKKLDRIIEIAERDSLPMIMFAEGGGGRPGDVDAEGVNIAGLDVPTFTAWAGLDALKIAVAHGYCFAGNAALYGAADIRIATKNSYVGMAGPAMIEGGGLGSFRPEEIGPSKLQYDNGLIDILAEDEDQATDYAQQVLAYFQGDLSDWQSADQTTLNEILPQDRRFTYEVRGVIDILADTGSFLELRGGFGKSLVTGLMRVRGKACAVIANDCLVLGGALDASSAQKLSDFLRFCENYQMPIVSLCDTPGFMVGPDSESQNAVMAMSSTFAAGAHSNVSMTTIVLRRAYGLGAMAMAKGSFKNPVISVAWPTGEFGGMGLEGAVRLGFKKELAAAESEEAREELFNGLVAGMYARGRATEAAAFLEIDGVIQPSETRDLIAKYI